MEFCAQEKGPSACIVSPHGRAGRNNVSGKNCLIWAEHDNDNVLISNNINNAPLLGRAIVAANHRTAGPVQSSHVASYSKTRMLESASYVRKEVSIRVLLLPAFDH
jgi:ABC-type nitrate/sulfonate/bicarbonate transport system ATPase subunit